MCQANTKQQKKKPCVDILILDKIKFMTRSMN